MTMPIDDIEEWRPMTRAPEHYEVSSHGRVRRAIYAPIAHTGITWPGRILKPCVAAHGYLNVQLTVRSKYVFAGPLHIIIAEAFLSPRPTPKHTVNHVDGNKLNNRPGNLEWATRLEQTRHAIRLGLMDPQHLKKYYEHGGKPHNSKLTEEIVRVIRNAPPRFSSLDLAELFGVTTSTISRVRHGIGFAARVV